MQPKEQAQFWRESAKYFLGKIMTTSCNFNGGRLGRERSFNRASKRQ